MTRHPGDTRHLIALAGLQPGARVLDLGAGDGDGVRLLRSLGYDACGMDKSAAPDVTAGDFLRTGGFQCHRIAEPVHKHIHTQRQEQHCHKTSFAANHAAHKHHQGCQ